MSRSLTTKKAEIVARILKNDVYSVDSKTYEYAFNALLNLSQPQLKSIDLILTFRVHDSVELARQVDKILEKPQPQNKET